jgi:mRNA-degrading endonuclease RelE of RelBE toxin-antitoxin system
MTELPAPERIAVIWSSEGRVDLRAIDRETAMQILHCVDRYLASRSGDVKKLKPPRTGFRLRCSDYRVFFDQKNDTTITITGVRHRTKPTADLCQRQTRMRVQTTSRGRAGLPCAASAPCSSL